MQPTTVAEIAESPSTKKENEAEINITEKPDDNEMLTTINNEHETYPASNNVYSSTALYSSTIILGEQSKEPLNKLTITSTASSGTTIFPFEESTTPPVKLATHDTESTGISSENVSDSIVTSSSPEFSTVTESTYSKESQHSPSTTMISSLSSTDYEEIKTTLPPSSLAAQNIPDLASTAAVISDEVQTTRLPETNEIVSEEGSTVASISQSTLVPIHANVTEKQSSTIPSEITSPMYTPIQHSTWTPKPVNGMDSFSGIGETTSSSSSEVNPSAPSSNGTSGTGGIIGSDNTLIEEYDEEPNAFGPGTCRYNGKQYISAQQIPRDDPCDFCFCFRSDIICLQQSCPPPIHGCRQEPIQGFCCPRYECPVARDIGSNATLQTTTAEATSPITTTMHATRTARVPHYSYRGGARQAGCVINGYFYNIGDDISIASGPCLECA